MEHIGSAGHRDFTLPAALRLPVGRTVDLKLIELLGDGRMKLTLGGRSVIADFAGRSADLTPGASLTAIVRGHDDQGRIVLELLGERGEAVLRRLEIPADSVHRAATEALARSGLPIDPAIVEQIARSVRNMGSDTGFLSRIAALFRRKNAPESLIADAVTEIREYSHSHGDGDRTRSDDSSYHSLSQSSRSKRERGELAREIRRAIVDQDTDDVRFGALTLFNHLKGGERHWTLIPLSVEPFDRTTLALEFDPDVGLVRSTLLIAFSGVRIQATWFETNAELALSTNDHSITDLITAMLPELNGALEQFALHVDRVRTSDQLDGFSDESLENILPQVDADV